MHCTCTTHVTTMYPHAEQMFRCNKHMQTVRELLQKQPLLVHENTPKVYAKNTTMCTRTPGCVLEGQGSWGTTK